MTVTTHALTARRRSLREVIRLETAVVDHMSTMQRLVMRKINDDADVSPVGLLLLVLWLRNLLRIRDYSFTYRLRVTIHLQIPLPSVMCPCVT